MVLERVGEFAQPDKLLHAAINRCIKEALDSAPAAIDRIAIEIDSDNLDFPIQVPLRKTWQNSAGAVLNEFLKVGQWHRHASLFGAPIRVN